MVLVRLTSSGSRTALPSLNRDARREDLDNGAARRWVRGAFDRAIWIDHGRLALARPSGREAGWSAGDDGDGPYQSRIYSFPPLFGRVILPLL
jgi:hypothetical protein